jgi:hypothetical protein
VKPIMQQRIKHSKYRNTGILFELLIRQITSDMMSSRDSKAVSILKKYFRNTELSKELNLYNTLLKNYPLSETKAEMLISTICEQSKKLNQEILEKEKFNLIREVKKHYNLDDFFKAKINNYKVSAAIYTILEAANAKTVVDTEQLMVNKLTVFEHVTTPAVKNIEDPSITDFIREEKEIKALSYKFLVEKFNEKYNTLSSDQKEILKEYINNISDTVKLKAYLNNKIEEVKQTLLRLSGKVENPVTVIKLQEVLKNIQPISNKQNIKDDHLISLMQYCELVKELKNTVSK